MVHRGQVKNVIIMAGLIVYFIESSVNAVEPLYPILSIPGSSNPTSANNIVNNYTETQYTDNFVPRQSPRNDSYGFVPPVVSGDTGWSWSSSAPNQIISTPSGTVFPTTTAYPIYYQAVLVTSGKTIQMPYYLRAGSSTAKSMVFELINHNKRNKLRSDLNVLAPTYMASGTSHAARNQAYARRIAIALLDWAHYMPDYGMTAKNSATYIDAGPTYVLASDLQRASDHNGLAHEWADDELFAFDAIYDSPALAQLSTELGYDVRQYIVDNLYCNEGDFIANRVPISVAIASNLSGPYTILALVARVLNKPNYIEYMDQYLDATVTKKIQRDGTLSEGMGYSIGYINENLAGARNTRDYFITRPADTPILQAISVRAANYVSTLEYGQDQWETASLPNGQLPSFGDTPFNTYFSARNTGTSVLLPAYGSVSMGAGTSSSTAVQINQCFAGDNNHMRSDTCAYILWAFGNEVLGNVRYHNGTPGRQFTEQILAYNAVTIDRSDMANPSAGTYGNGDLTLYEPGDNGLAVTEIDGQRAYNNKASRYQRIMMLNTSDVNRPYVVDVFRVTGGTTHDYVWHGSIRYDQTSQCSFALTPMAGTYPMLEGTETWVEPTSSGSSFPYYGFFRNMSSNPAPGNFQIAYLDTSRTSPRDMKFWMTADPGQYTVYIGRTPVPSRANGEPDDWWVNGLWRPSMIIRKRVTSGPLSDLFVSVIEPQNNGVSSIQSIQRLPMTGSALESVGLKIMFTDGRVDTILVNLRNPQVAGASGGSQTISSTDAQYVLTGRIGMHSTGSAGSRVWAVNASDFHHTDGSFTPSNLYYSGTIIGETRILTGDSRDAFITTTPLPLGTALHGKQLSMTFGSLSGSGTTGISQMFEIDQVIQSNGQYYICFAKDHYLEINSTITVEQVAPLRTFTGVNSFEIALSASQAASSPGTPTGVRAIPANGQVTLNWDAISGATGYHVKKATVNGGPYVTIANPPTAYYADTDVTNGTMYYYVISAVNEAGESPDSTQVSVTPSSSVPMGMVARLTFDDATVNDSSGYDNHGVMNGGVVSMADAARGRVLSFDGVSGSYIRVTNSASLNAIANQITVVMWLYMNSTAVRQLIEKGGTSGSAWYTTPWGIRLETDRRLHLHWGNVATLYSTAIPVNTWTHIAMTYDSALGSSQAKFYINGVLNTQADWATLPSTNTNDLFIGTDFYNNTSRWAYLGRMDDVCVFNRALCLAEIRKLISGNPDGDINGDGNVTLADFSYLSAQWLTDGQVGPSADIAPSCGDGSVDILDLILMANHLLESN